MNIGEQIKSCRIPTGDWVGSAWGGSPEWSPYAEAIAAHYPAIHLWYLTMAITVGNPPPSLTLPRVMVTKPQQHDVLIFGMSATQTPAPSASGIMYLGITHQETGIPWVASNQLGYAPLPAFAGLNLNPTSILKLPEAFFLPRHTSLKLEWLPFSLDIDPPVTVKLTMVGVQLINPAAGFKAPKEITMPNGQAIPVGSRLPWFACIPFGLRRDLVGIRAFGNFVLDQRTQAVQFTPPANCTVEVHDTYASFLDSPAEFNDLPELLVSKMRLTRRKESWNPIFTPVQANFGSITQINVTSPFPKPILLEAGQRIEMVEQNNNTGINNEVTRGTVTFRGVRLCEY
jgi:hypothetical protein